MSGAGGPVVALRVGVRRVRRAVLAALLAVGAVVGLAPPSWSDAERWLITRYDADIDVGADGVATVRIEFDFDFGDEPGHGPFLTLPTRQRIEGDDERDRLYRITDITASSETAPDDLLVEHGPFDVSIRIGDEDVDDVQGVHTYTVTYRVDGWVNPAGTRLGTGSPPEDDELYLDVIGTGWEIPLADVTATVTGPADVIDALCFAGRPGSDVPCTAQPSSFGGRTVVVGHDLVWPGQAFTVVAAWPAGTFTGAEPILGEAVRPSDAWRPASPIGAAALVLLLVGGAFVVDRARRGGRDRQALGLPGGPAVPGLHVDRARTTGFREHRPPVASRFTPPDGVLPGELGTLLDEVADPGDVTATIVDLAVRGYLEIREVPSLPGHVPEDWELVTTGRDTRELTAFERRLLADLFADRRSVRLSEVRTTFRSSMAAVQDLLYRHVTELGWFRANPRSVRIRWYAAGAALVVAGVLTGVAGVSTLVHGLALLGAVLAVLGLLVLVVARVAPARTAAGTAVLAEAVAFKRYLETADAPRLLAVHGEDQFSRYLPYAIAFGVAGEWARAFDDLTAHGVPVPRPTWYVPQGAVTVTWGFGGGIATGVDGFVSTATEAIWAARPASSGSSGRSGGFSGGGVGGGGGGGW